MTRQVFLTFFGKPRNHHKFEHAHEVAWQMLVPLIILGSLALIGGLGGWFQAMNPKTEGIEQVRQFAAHGHASPVVEQALAAAGHEAAAPEEAAEGHGEHIVHAAHRMAMVLSIALAFAGIGLGLLMYYERSNGRSVWNPATLAARFQPIYRLLWNKYYMDELYQSTLVVPTVVWGRAMALFDRAVIDGVVNLVGAAGMVWAFVTDLLDRMIVDDWMVMGSARMTAFAGDKLSYTETGRVRQYLVFTVIGLVVIAGLCFWMF